MNIQIPATNIRNTHIVTAQFRCLNVPYNILAISVLVSDFHQRCGHSIHSLPVNVKPVPGIGELYHWVSFEGLLKQYALDGDSQMDQSKSGRYFFRSQLKLNRGEIAGCSRAVVHEVQTSSWYLKTFLHHLGRRKIRN